MASCTYTRGSPEELLEEISDRDWTQEEIDKEAFEAACDWMQVEGFIEVVEDDDIN